MKLNFFIRFQSKLTNINEGYVTFLDKPKNLIQD